MTKAQYELLVVLDFVGVGGEAWWHDLPSSRKVLWRKKWIRESRHIRCNTRGHRHPGYVVISAKGRSALRKEAARRRRRR